MVSRGLRLALLALVGVLLSPIPPAAGAPPKARPDLVVAQLADPPADVLRGQRFRVTDTVRNKGRGRAARSVVRYYLSADTKQGKGDLVVGKHKVPALAKGKRSKATVLLTVPATAPYRTFRLVACADAKRKVRETKERNCRVAAKAVRVRPRPVTPPVDPPVDPPGLDPSPIDPTVPTDFEDSVEFLWTGEDAVQQGVAEDAIDTDRVVVLRGRALDDAGKPVPGVRVTVLDHPELGHTLTREDGAYDIAVNGGAAVTLDFAKDGMLPAQRTATDVPWLDFVVLDDLVMGAVAEQATVVSPATADEPVVAEAAPVTDEDGTRQAVLLFEPGTKAAMTLPDGSERPLDRMTVRVTEYTVGEDGQARMPAVLPPTSGYTYAAEFSIDEAVEAGATTVEFTEPVVNYLENYLDMPVGVVVPSGYYDREQARWVAGRNGRVIAVVGESGGVADVDVDGDGAADTGSVLTSLGLDEAERAVLAERYDAGQELWRVRLEHFSSWDHNWPYGPPDGARSPGQPAPGSGGPGGKTRPCIKGGSIIGCQSQTLAESLPVTGTGYSLEYTSARAHGRAEDRTLSDIPVTGNDLGPLEFARLTISVAGRTFVKTFPPVPNQTHTFVWDGLDAYGRRLRGEHRVNVQVDYHYQLQYYASWSDFDRSFGRLVTEGGGPSDLAFSIDRDSQTIALTSSWSGWLGTWTAPVSDLGGWSLSAKHVYDPASGTLHLGDGSSRRADTLDVITRPYAEIVRNSVLFSRGVDIDAQGRLFATAGQWCHCVQRIDGPAQVTVVAGGRTAGFSGDGGPAADATLNDPQGVAVAPDGTVFISDTDNHRVRKVAPDGTITTIAGTGTPAFSGDGGAATEAALSRPTSLALGPDGSLFVVDQGNQRIRRVATDGVITTIAGSGRQEPTDAGIPATEAAIAIPTSVAVGPDGSVYYAERRSTEHGSAGWVRRITPDGQVATVTGRDGDRPLEDDARVTAFGTPTGLAVDSDGTVHVAEQDGYRVRSVGTDGFVRTYVGRGDCCEPTPGEPARAAKLHPYGLAVGPDDRLHLMASGGPFVVGPVSPRLAGGELSVPSADGSMLYQFTRAGRHLRTVNSVTLAVIHEFGYDAAGRLRAITDSAGRVTTVERDDSGAPRAIVAPGGQRTTLSVDGYGALASVANPAGETTTLATGEDGLLLSLTDPMGHTSTFGYDSRGRLTSDEHSELGRQTLVRTELSRGYRVVHTSAEGLETTYEETLGEAGKVISTTTDAAGGRTVVTQAPDGSTTASYPDGSTLRTETRGDPRWGMAAPYESQVTTRLPSGRTMSVQRNRLVTLSDRADPLSVRETTDVLTVNHREERYRYDVTTGEITSTSAGGVRTSSKVDEHGRVLEIAAAAGAAPITYTYDDLGRVESVSQADQRESYTYDARGRTATMTDGLGNVTTYTWDDADRLASMTLPGLPRRTYTYGYDANGNRTSITMPNGQVHSLTYTPRGQLAGYQPGADLPGLLDTRDDDGKVLDRTLPDGSVLTNGYEDGGRFAGTAYTEADLHFTYVAESEVVDVLTRTPAEGSVGATAQVLDLDHDATLLTRATAGGVAEGTHSYTYDNSFWLTGIELTSRDDRRTLGVTRDQDGMITKAGDFTWARTGIGRRVGSVGDGVLDADYSYDATRRFTGRADTVAGKEAYDLDLTFDDAGRVATKTEEVAGADPVTWSYVYDETGQLESVARDGRSVEGYGYDVNGNRTAPTATYDAQDRMTSRGGTSYTFDDNGFLTGRGDERFSYSEKGELLSATVGGETVTYAYDATGRMVARIDDAGTREYLYGNPGQPFQVTASRAPGGVLTSLEYDEEGRLYAMRRGGSVFYVSSDHLGSPRVVTDSAGTVVATREYDAFGVPVAERALAGADFDLPVGFAGGIEDPLTGLVRFGFRDYEPQSGRWTTRDPALFAGGQANLYVYVQNNPVVLKDPAGLWCVGGSLYGGIGGGAQICEKDGERSVCAEVGFGIGADVGFEMGGPAETGDEVGVEAKGVCGPIGLGGGCSLDNCGEAKCKGKGEAGPVTVDTDLNFGLQPNLDGGPEAVISYGGRPKCSLQGKLYGKVCQKF